jgi:hypothetical protein
MIEAYFLPPGANARAIQRALTPTTFSNLNYYLMINNVITLNQINN